MSDVPLRRHGSAFALALIALIASTACGTRYTELVVTIDLGPGLAPMRDVESIDVAIYSGGHNVVQQSVPITGTAATPLPLTLGLRSASGQASTVEVRATAVAPGGTDLVSRRVLTQFVPGERRLLAIVLEAACAGHACADASTTCVGGACVDATIPPSELAPFEGDLPDAARPMDAGVDAARPTDGGRDGGLDAPADAGSDAGPDAASCEGDAMTVGMPTGCTLHHPPARPTCGEGGDDGLVHAFALIDPVLDQSGVAWATSSYDLDGLCTNPLSPPVVTECNAPMGGSPVLDGAGGEDNALGQVAYVSLVTFAPSYSGEVRAGARRGRTVPVLRITGWNGLDDDARVNVIFATSIDVLPAGTDVPDGGLALSNGLPDPAWDGTDTVYVGSNYFAAGDPMFPLIADDNAYVAGRTLVMTLPPRAPIDVPTRESRAGVARIRLTEAHLVAHISADGGTLEGAVLVGRWAYVDALTYLDALGVCPSDPLSGPFVTSFNVLLQRSLDVRSTAGSGGPTIDCDALSSALPFEIGVSVHWGGPLPLTIVPATCP